MASSVVAKLAMVAALAIVAAGCGSDDNGGVEPASQLPETAFDILVEDCRVVTDAGLTTKNLTLKCPAIANIFLDGAEDMGCTDWRDARVAFGGFLAYTLTAMQTSEEVDATGVGFGC